MLISIGNCEEVREKAHGEAEEGETVACTKEKIDRECPEEKEKEEGGELEEVVCGGLTEGGRYGDREHPAAVKATYGKEVQQSEEQGCAGEQACKGKLIP